jgi:hypothetical protein
MEHEVARAEIERLLDAEGQCKFVPEIRWGVVGEIRKRPYVHVYFCDTALFHRDTNQVYNPMQQRTFNLKSFFKNRQS